MFPSELVRVVTYNMHKGVSSLMRRCTMQAIRAGLHGLEADIIFLQEVSGRHSTGAPGEQYLDHSQLDILAGDVFPYRVYGKNASYHDRHHGNAILSRYPIVRWENLDISDHIFERRGLLHAVAQIGTCEVHLICLHLGLFPRGRQHQVQKLIARVLETVPSSAPVLIAGDFNDWRKRLHQPLTQALSVQEVCGVSSSGKQSLPRTFPSRLPWLQLDRIYARRMLVHHSHVVCGASWRSSSDHRPLLAALSLI
jgi:endonuclease/exonuclease/phosphatase family metal-dependent hydrolase